MGWWTVIELVYAYDFIIGARRQITAVRREADGVDGAEVVAHVAELSRLRVGLVLGAVDGLGRPNADMAIYKSEWSSQHTDDGDCLRDAVQTYHRRPWPVSSHRARCGSCRPQSPSARLSFPSS